MPPSLKAAPVAVELESELSDALESELLESEPALLEPPQAARLNTMAAAITKAKTFFFIWNLLLIKMLTNVI